LSAGPLLALDVPMTKDGPGHFILIQPKWKKALSAGPLLALDVPMTKDGPGCFILIQPTVLSLCVIANRRRRKAGCVLSVILLEGSCGWWQQQCITIISIAN
jgi:hypothetical protein